MRPGRFSVLGFLGPAEHLAEVLARDDATVRELDLTHRRLADELSGLLALAEGDTRRRVTVERHFRVAVTVYKGFQICPWAPQPPRGQCTAEGGPRFASLDWTVRNLRTGTQERGPGLLEHLIRAHHFYEGIESPYRVSPARLAQLLDLAAHG
jgi:hypothetical protein